MILENKINVGSFSCYERKHKEFVKNNKLILETQQRSKSERHNIFTEEINNNDLSSNDDKRMQSIDSIEIYAYGASKVLVSENDELKYSNIKNDTEMINFNDVAKENIKEHNPSCL